MVDVVRYADARGQRFRVHRHRRFVGEYATVEELAEEVDLGELVEDDEPGQAATPANQA